MHTSIRLDIACNALFPFDLRHAILQVSLLVVLHVHCRYEERCVREQIVHLFQWPFCGLRLEGPEEKCVREIADDLQRISKWRSSHARKTYEDIVVSIGNVCLMTKITGSANILYLSEGHKIP